MFRIGLSAFSQHGERSAAPPLFGFMPLFLFFNALAISRKKN